MNNKHLLVNCITLLYWANVVNPDTEEFYDLVNQVIDTIDVADEGIVKNTDNVILNNLKNTIGTLIDVSKKNQYSDLMKRLKIDLLEDQQLYAVFKDSIDVNKTDTEMQLLCITLSRSLRDYLKELNTTNAVLNAANKLRFKRNSIKNFKSFVNDLKDKLDDFGEINSDTETPGVLEFIKLSDKPSLSNVFNKVKNNINNNAILKTGLQEFNSMWRGGIRRGELICCNALSSNFKSSFSLTIFKGIALYNVPFMFDSRKKPALVWLTFEDETKNVLSFLYTSLKGNETKEEVDVENISSDEIADYVQSKLSINGYEIFILRANPHLCTYRDIIDIVLKLESEGYEIHLLGIDYLGLASTEGCRIGPMGTEVRDLFSKVRNHCSPKGIAILTPHQLSTDAKTRYRDGASNFVKDLPGRGYYDKCKSLENELDGDFYIHIEECNKIKYLTIQRGKHRLPGQTSPSHLYIVYAMNPVCGIYDDINSENTARKRVGGGITGSHDEIPFWETT